MKLKMANARAGLGWIGQGFRVFGRQPFSFFSMFILFTLVISLIAWIPYVGTLIALIFVPSAYLGFMVASKEVVNGKFAHPWSLFMVLRLKDERRLNLIKLGVYYLVGLSIIVLISSLVDGGSFARMYLFAQQPSLDVMQSSPFVHAALIAMVLYIPLCMIFWHAPALIYWGNLTPFKAMFFSFVAIKRNLIAFIVFVVLWFIMGMLIMMLTSSVGSMIGSKEILVTLISIAMLFIATVFLSSIYFSYQSCFEEDGNNRASL